MKIKGKEKIIAVTLAGTITAGTMLNQWCEINQLEKELQIQQNITSM